MIVKTCQEILQLFNVEHKTFVNCLHCVPRGMWQRCCAAASFPSGNSIPISHRKQSKSTDCFHTLTFCVLCLFRPNATAGRPATTSVLDSINETQSKHTLTHSLSLSLSFSLSHTHTHTHTHTRVCAKFWEHEVPESGVPGL